MKTINFIKKLFGKSDKITTPNAEHDVFNRFNPTKEEIKDIALKAKKFNLHTTGSLIIGGKNENL